MYAATSHGEKAEVTEWPACKYLRDHHFCMCSYVTVTSYTLAINSAVKRRKSLLSLVVIICRSSAREERKAHCLVERQY